jgi:hypothetical protein
MRVYFGAYIWSLYKFWSLYLVPLFGAFIWSLYLEPILIWSLYLEPPALARVVLFFGICSKAPNKGTKWCLYLVPSWLGALLSGAFLKIRCSVGPPVEQGLESIVINLESGLKARFLPWLQPGPPEEADRRDKTARGAHFFNALPRLELMALKVVKIGT